MRHPPILPALSLTAGLFGAIAYCLFTAYLPPKALLVLASALVIITFFFGRFLLCGLGLGLIAIGCNAPTPYTDNFHHCQFDAQMIRPNYSHRHLGQEIRLYATNIICKNAHLPAQTIQYWDNSKKFSGYMGKRLVVSANLTPIHSRLNPYEFDYERYLLSEGIRLSAKKLTIIHSKNESNPLLNVKKSLSDTLFHQLSANNAGIILALLTGNRTALSPEQKTTMQATGTSHLLAISGLHLALIGGMTWLVFQWLWALSWRLSDRLSPRHAGAIAALVVITVYATFTGFDIPVKRAWIMFSLLILSWLFGRSLSSSSLLLAACTVLFISPYAVVSVGFYFSFIATFVVLWSARLPYSPLVNVLIMQAAINLMLFPITWLTFGIISPVAFFVNLLVIPWLGLWVLPWSVLASLVGFISDTLASPIWALVDKTTTLLWQTIAFAEQLNGTLSPDFRPSLLAVIVALTAVMLALISGKKWLFSGIVFVCIPLTPTAKPALIVADRGYASALIHNGKQAILINPGRRYRHINHAKTWLRYLQQNQLELSAIVLENDKLTRISATQWLLASYPNARVMTLEQLDLPYPSHFCQSLQLDNLHLNSQRQGTHCHSSIKWFQQEIALFSDAPTNIANPATLIWEDNRYDASTLGAVVVTYQNSRFSIDSLRHRKRLWRSH